MQASTWLTDPTYMKANTHIYKVKKLTLKSRKAMNISLWDKYWIACELSIGHMQTFTHVYSLDLQTYKLK